MRQHTILVFRGISGADARIQFWAYFVDFFCKRPPSVSTHFPVHQGWSLTRELCTSHLKPPDPPIPLGHEWGKAGTFTSYSPHFAPLVGREYARNHGLRLPDWGISGAVTPWSAVCIFAPHSNLVNRSAGAKAHRHTNTNHPLIENMMQGVVILLIRNK